jgi:hypothetical protein
MRSMNGHNQGNASLAKHCGRLFGLGRRRLVDYGEGPVNIVGIVELADGKVNAARFYFADPFDPAAGRARWSDTPID